MQQGFSISLRSKVKAKTTGLVGIVTSAGLHLNGCARFLVQPKADKDGKVPSAWWYDEVNLEVLDAFVADPVRVTNGFAFSLGTKVIDTVTGQKGVITNTSINLNGVHGYWISPPVDDDNKPVDGAWVDENRLSALNEEALGHKEVKTGGPASTSC